MTRKTAFVEGWSWFKFNNLGLALDKSLKFYTTVAKGLKLKVRKFGGIIPKFVEIIREKLVGEPFDLPILNRVKPLVVSILEVASLHNTFHSNKGPCTCQKYWSY